MPSSAMLTRGSSSLQRRHSSHSPSRPAPHVPPSSRLARRHSATTAHDAAGQAQLPIAPLVDLERAVTHQQQQQHQQHGAGHSPSHVIAPATGVRDD
jgi:hypothetical protein